MRVVLPAAAAIACAACDAPVSRTSGLPATDRAILERFPASELCRPVELKATQEALGTSRDVSAMSTEDITRWSETLGRAQAVDAARELVSHEKAGPAAHYRAAWATHAAAVSRVAALDWKTGRLSDDDRIALLEVIDALKSDRVEAVVAAGRAATGGAFGEAYGRTIAEARSDMARLDSTLHRTKAEIDSLPRDDATLLSRLALLDTATVSRLLAAHAVDFASSAARAARRLADPAYRAAYESNRHALDSVVTMDWRKDRVALIGGAAVCEVLGAYLKAPR